MSEFIKKDAELFTELSELEQETVGGGCFFDMFESFFFQQTDIRTFAEAEANDSTTNSSASQRTGYSFSQTTLAFTSPRFSRRRSGYGRRSRFSSLFNLFW